VPTQLDGTQYLDVDDVLVLFAELFNCSIEAARDQLTRPELLASALARPMQHAHYQDADVALQAAVLAHGIAENQSFIDGNKRIAALTVLTFLDVNGHEMTGSDPDEVALAAWIIDLSEGLTLEKLARWLRPRLHARS